MRMQLLTLCAWLLSGFESTTVQAPQSPLAQPSLVSVARSSSRSTSSKVRAGGTLVSEKSRRRWITSSLGNVMPTLQSCLEAIVAPERTNGIAP